MSRTAYYNGNGDLIVGGVCTYRVSWIGQCNRSTGSEHDRCEQHDAEHKAKCWGCGDRATRDCEYALMWACATPICDSCMHQVWGVHHR